MVLDLWSEIFVVILLIIGVPNAGAVRTGELRTYQSTAKNLAPSKDLIAVNNAHVLYVHGDNEIHSAGLSPELQRKLTVPETFYFAMAIFPAVASEDADSPNSYHDGFQCNYLENLEYTQVTTFLPDGMPAFRVTFTNTCLDCCFHNIHILCGDFSSPKLVNPKIFRRLSPGNCLLNNGAAFHPQDMVEFEYESTYAYPMQVGKALCSC